MQESSSDCIDAVRQFMVRQLVSGSFLECSLLAELVYYLLNPMRECFGPVGLEKDPYRLLASEPWCDVSGR